jgi:hypothetical protein
VVYAFRRNGEVKRGAVVLRGTMKVNNETVVVSSETVVMTVVLWRSEKCENEIVDLSSEGEK